MDIRTSVGQHFITGFPGTEIPDDFIRAVKRYKIGNVILFRRNVADAAQLRRLTGELTALIEGETGIPPLIAIDQEGGPVSRLGEDATVFPSAMAVAATGDPELAYRAGRVTGEELRAMGVNFNLAPVLDVSLNPKNPSVGVRSYGDDPERVAVFGTAAMQGLLDGGVLSSLKHFPGHGDTAVDSHIGLPVIEKTADKLLSCELVPFERAIRAGAPFVMTAHILFPKIEPDNLPATMSRRIVTGLLRERMGFPGLVISDCMMMDAITKHFGSVPGTLAALRAGVDLVIVSHDANLAGEAIEETERALANGSLDADAFLASTRRMLAVKKTLPAVQPPFAVVGSPAHRAVSRAVTTRALTLVSDAPFTLGDRPAFLGCRRTRATLVFSPGADPLCFSEALKARLGGIALEAPQDPTDAEIQALLAACAGCTSVTVGLSSSVLYPGQRALAEAAAAMHVPVCCVALRAPYDLAGLPEGVRRIAAYDYDARTFSAIADLFTNRLTPTGTLPVRLSHSTGGLEA